MSKRIYFLKSTTNTKTAIFATLYIMRMVNMLKLSTFNQDRLTYAFNDSQLANMKKYIPYMSLP